jgi:branched-chain amino acid aminotransferase
MFLMNYNLQDGWHKPRIEPRRDLVLHPACMVFHYGQEVFEGLKAYRGDQGELYLFRHRDNLERLNQSCERMVIPKLDIDLVSKALKQLLTLEQRWFPSSDGCALYIRPTVIATDPYLGVRPSNTYLFYILLSPVGAYYPEGFNPVSIYVSTEYIRAAKGGTGQAKTGGNYAASMAAQKEALQAGYSQVLWLDARERKYIEEVGTMNIFFRIADKLITSPLTQTILPGITRDSVLHIARTWGITVEERDISIDEVIAASEQGHLQEIFGSGTAAIISPVKRFCYDKRDYIVADGNTGEWANKFYRYLLDLQYGRIPDPFGWCERI